MNSMLKLFLVSRDFKIIEIFFSNIRDHKCDHCDMAFCTRQTLRTHLKMQHKIVLPTESKKGKKLGPRNKTKLKRPDSLAAEEPPNMAAQHAMETQSVHSEDSYAPQGYFHPGHWMGFSLDPPFAPTQVQVPPRQKITSIPVDIRYDFNSLRFWFIFGIKLRFLSQNYIKND